MAVKTLGYNLTYAGTKCLSVSTGVQRDGTCDVFVNALAGPGVERHLHGYAQVTTDGVVVHGGARLKDNVGAHLGPGLTLRGTTQEIGRVRISQTSLGLRCELGQVIEENWVAATPTTMGGTMVRRQVALPYDATQPSAEYSIRMFDARSGVPSDSTNQIVLPFSAPVPFGIAVRKV